MMPEYNGDERRQNCSEHSDTIKTVLAAASLMRWVVVVLPLLLMLVGYNIRATNQLKVVIAENFAKVGGQLATSSVRIKNIERGIESNHQSIIDHEQRLRVLEQQR